MHQRLHFTDSDLSAAASIEQAFEPRYQRTDRLFGVLMLLQGAALIILSIMLTPTTWSGTESFTHAHIWVSTSLGILITGFPAFLAFSRPGLKSTRIVISISQMLVTALLIHISGGRIEMHFHAFVSLAVLATYLDISVIVAATLTIAADHLVRGVLFPQSVFGDATIQVYRIVEHALWVLFEDAILIVAIMQSRETHRQMHETFNAIHRCMHAMKADSSQVASGDELFGSIEEGLLIIRDAMLMVQHSVSDIDSQTGVLSQTASAAVDVVNAGACQAEQSRDVIRRLHGSVDEIAASIAEINVIAEQTRLLALNATIEAARSNASGAGFAVVAKQVKELSVKASVAANRINKTAQECVARVAESLRATDAIADQLEEVKAIVRSTDETIGRIRIETSSSSLEAERIARAFDVSDSTFNSKRLRTQSFAGQTYSSN